MRDFIVNYTIWRGNDETACRRDVNAMDALQAEQTVRRDLNRATDVTGFRFDLVREVRMVWDTASGRFTAPVIHIPEWYSHTITVMHR